MKLMIISWIIFLVLFIWLKGMVLAMDSNEKLVYKLTGTPPTRIAVFSILIAASFIECIISTIVFVVRL